ncbi:sensor histidine kinase [Geofilum sp. OHC36d9]|uniref:sensor histidine kinase n=1 Tax=Geofilum sp. OHC36d9 TaxID=3458413 RepID=UPI004034DA7B
MEIYNKTRWWKLFLFVGAGIISLFSLLYTNRLVTELKKEEQKKIELWAEANRQLAADSISKSTLTLVLEIISNNTTVPVIVTNNQEEIVFHRNIKLPNKHPEIKLKEMLERMKKFSHPLPVKLSDNDYQYIYYNKSLLLVKLQWFPIVQLIIVFIFMAIAYAAFSFSRKWEQDKVWVGLARETAHQLGTPTSSLLGWVDVLKMKNTDPELLSEMQYDVQRLQTITSRFSKIGSKPDLIPENINEVIAGMVNYLKKRSSARVVFTLDDKTTEPIVIPICRSLFEWVIENICKNAIDAMAGEGHINILLQRAKTAVIIDISDTGKGMTKSTQKSAFKPGYSTKKRGWGLGLTLSQRIIQQYHGGNLSIITSAPGKGTTFRIQLTTAAPASSKKA